MAHAEKTNFTLRGAALSTGLSSGSVNRQICYASEFFPSLTTKNIYEAMMLVLKIYKIMYTYPEVVILCHDSAKKRFQSLM